jgi:hypothetical protein
LASSLYSSRDHLPYDAFYLIEIKPAVGDDYPAVLRQMKRNGSTILFLKSYVGAGATREQFIATFAAAGFRVVFRAGVDSMKNKVAGLVLRPGDSEETTAAS